MPCRRGKAFPRRRSWGSVALPGSRRRLVVVVAVGGALLAAAVLASTGAPAPALPPSARWSARDTVLGEGQGFLREGEAWVGNVNVRSLALREMVALLSWQEDAPGSAPDEFTLELVPPPGLFAGPVAEGSGGTLEVRVPVYARPPLGAPQIGVGSWAVRVYLRSAGDSATLGILPGAPDSGNPFHLAVTGTVWERS